jgi:hypothetical protein
LVERVLAHQWSDLDHSGLTAVGQGWDHAVWRCGDVLLRFPHQTGVIHEPVKPPPWPVQPA